MHSRDRSKADQSLHLYLPLIYSPYDEEESDSENYPPYVADNSAAWEWPIPTVLPNPPVHCLCLCLRLDQDRPCLVMEMTPPLPEDQSWGVNLPSPTLPLRTRTGRAGRWSSVGRPFPVLEARPMMIGLCHPFLSTIAASEREIRDGRAGDVTMVDSGNDNPVSIQGGEGLPAALDPDGELVVWGSSASDTDGEYKPANYFFDR